MFFAQDQALLLSAGNEALVGFVAAALVRQLQAAEEVDVGCLVVSPALADLALGAGGKVDQRIALALDPGLVILQRHLIAVQIAPLRQSGSVQKRSSWSCSIQGGILHRQHSILAQRIYQLADGPACLRRLDRLQL